MATHITQCDSPELLPFARSRLKALRATGLSYIGQKYDVGGSTVAVRIEGSQDFISISGGGSILSGVVRGGATEVVLTPELGVGTFKYTMRDFKPTYMAWKYVMKDDVPAKSPALFNDEDRLVVRMHPSLDYADNPGVHRPQAQGLSGSMYSGLMAKLVQVLMGYGKMDTGLTYADDATNVGADASGSHPHSDLLHGVQIRYNYRYSHCNGVTTAADGKKWLVQISKLNGVLIMPLPYLPTGKSPKGSGGSIGKVKALFGGFPSGQTFPTGTSLADAITAGTVIRLLTDTDMLPMFDTDVFPHSEMMGWSFNDDGTEAHNTTTKRIPNAGHVLTTSTVIVMGQHYKLSITIGKTVPDVPLIASATLTLVEEGELWTSLSGAMFSVSREKTIFASPSRAEHWQRFAEATPANLYGGYVIANPSGPGTIAVAGPAYPAKIAPVFVLHVNNTVEVIRLYMSEVISEIILGGVAQKSWESQWGITTSKIPQQTTRVMMDAGGAPEPLRPHSYGVWPAGARDCFIYKVTQPYDLTDYSSMSRVGIVFTDGGVVVPAFGGGTDAGVDIPFTRLKYADIPSTLVGADTAFYVDSPPPSGTSGTSTNPNGGMYRGICGMFYAWLNYATSGLSTGLIEDNAAVRCSTFGKTPQYAFYTGEATYNASGSTVLRTSGWFHYGTMLNTDTSTVPTPPPIPASISAVSVAYVGYIDGPTP